MNSKWEEGTFIGTKIKFTTNIIQKSHCFGIEGRTIWIEILSRGCLLKKGVVCFDYFCSIVCKWMRIVSINLVTLHGWFCFDRTQKNNQYWF